MNNVSFLFGSGADSVFGVCSGQSFMLPLLNDKYHEKIKTIDPELAKYKILYSQSRIIYINTIMNNLSIARDLFDSDIIEAARTYYNDDPSYREKINNRAKDWYKGILEGECDSQLKSEVDFFLDNGVFFDELDEKFNALRNIPLNSKAKRVAHAYYTILIEMVEDLYGLCSVDGLETIIHTLKNNEIIKDLSIENYYAPLADFDCSVNTTNYTDIAESLTRKKVGYLHGKLTWFEDYKSLKIYDITKTTIDDTSHIIPFIMIASGVKPIVAKVQIEQYHKFISDLEKSDLLIVVGYRFNSEDNDVNSIIAEWLSNSNNKMIFLNFDSSTCFERIPWIDMDNVCTVASVNEIQRNAIKNILNINVNRDNSLKVYNDILNMLRD